MKKVISLNVFVIIILSIFTGCVTTSASFDYNDINYVQLNAPQSDDEIAIITSNIGTIKFVLYPQYAPNTVEHFKKLVEADFYDGKSVYQIDTSNSLLLTGASDHEGTQGELLTDDQKGISVEHSFDLWHFTGAVSAYGTETGFLTKSILSDSRFFIVGYKEPDEEIIDKMMEFDFPQSAIDNYKTIGGVLEVSGAYTVFGQIYEGLDIINDAIALGVDENNKPINEIIIEDIKISTYS